jgi:hypothetical protein
MTVVKTKPVNDFQRISKRADHHILHVGLAFKTRLLSVKSVNIMVSGNVRIWGIDIDGNSNGDGGGSLQH